MKILKLSDSIVTSLLALYFSIWFGEVIPAFLGENALDYLSIGYCLFVFFLCIAFAMFVGNTKQKLIWILVVILNLVLIWLTVFWTSLLVIILLSSFQGILLGRWIKDEYLKNELVKSHPFMSLGVFLSLPFKLFYINDLKVQIGNFESNIIFGGVITLILLIILILQLMNKDELEKTNINQNNESWKPKIRYGFTFLIYGFVILEIIFILWSLILKDSNQDILNAINLPAICLIIFVIRKYINKAKFFNDLRWIFILAIFMTLGLGYFYTFDLSFTYVIVLGITISLLSYSTSEVFNFRFSVSQIGILFVLFAIINVLIALFIDNYMEFITSMKLPEEVWILSSKQALIKELAVYAGILTVVVGILFLNRRSLTIKNN